MVKLPNDLIEVKENLPNDLVEVGGLPNDLIEVKEPKKSLLETAITPISKLITGKSLTERAKIVESQQKEMEKLGTKRALEGKPPSIAEFFFRQLPSQSTETALNYADLTPLDVATTFVLPLAGKAALKTKTGQMLVRKYLPKSVGLRRALNPEEAKYFNWLKKPTVAPVAQELVEEQINPVIKITKLLKEAKPIRAEQELLYSIERSKRAGKIIEAGQTVPGEKGYFAQLKELKGGLPKVQFEGIRGKVLQADIDNLFNLVEHNSIISPYEKITAKTGLSKLLGAEGVAVPTEGELALLNKVFPPTFVQSIISKRTLTQKLFEGTKEVLNVPRAIMASADMSAPLRQGIFLIGRPKQWLPAFRDMFKYAFNEKAYNGLMLDIEKRTTYPLMKEGGLSLTNIGKSLYGREEKFMSNLAERIPVLGHIVRGSHRAHTGFLNKLRADVFDDMVSHAQKQGLRIEGKLLKDIGNFVSAATGRGKLPGAIERSAVTLNSLFFSPRLMASRVNLLNPVYYAKLDPFVRKEALKSLLTFAGTATSIVTLAKLGGADIGVDPRSADFGKIKIGNTRYDPYGGFQQYIRLAAQLITGEHISSTTGVKTTVGEGYKPLTRTDIIGRFLETKESPVVSFALGLLRGQDNLGKDFNIAQETAQRFIPMVAQDMYDLYKERGLEGIAMGTPAIFGAGLQTYSPNPTEIVYSAKSVIKHTKDLLNQGRNEEAKKLYLRNEKILKMGEKLEPLQEDLSKLERTKNLILNRVDIPPENKKKALTYTEKIIKKYGKAMEIKYKEIRE